MVPFSSVNATENIGLDAFRWACSKVKFLIRMEAKEELRLWSYGGEGRMHRDLRALHSEYCQIRACDHNQEAAFQPSSSTRNEQASSARPPFLAPCSYASVLREIWACQEENHVGTNTIFSLYCNRVLLIKQEQATSSKTHIAHCIRTDGI